MTHQLHEEVAALVEVSIATRTSGLPKKVPAKAMRLAKKAVEQVRFLVGNQNMRMRPRDEDKIRARVDKLINQILKVPGVGMGYQSVWDQVWAQAKSLGPVMPMPGKDI